MKKRAFLFFGIFLSVILMAILVSAQWYGNFQSASYQVIDIVKQVFGPFFEPLLGVSQFDQYFFERILLLILTYVIILTVLKKVEFIKKSPFAYILISAIMAILGARYISESQLIQGILFPQGVLAIALSIGLPFFIYFFFVHYSIESGVGRRVAWAFFAAVFFGLWYVKYSELGEMNTVYWMGIAVVALVFIFDKKVHTYFALAELKNSTRAMNDAQIVKLLNDRKDAMEAYNSTGSPSAKRQLERIDKLLKKYAVRQSQSGFNNRGAGI